MQTTGRCHCGAIEYAAELDEGRIGICHCTDCQVIGGGPFRIAAGVRAGQFEITKGEPKHYDKTAASGNRRRLYFCGTCGTSIYSAPADPDDAEGIISVRVATSAHRAELTPIAELWCSSRLPWLPPFEDVPHKFDRQLPSRNR